MTIWTLALNNQLTAPPAYDATHAYFPIEGDRVVAYELASGAQAWVVSARPQVAPATGGGLLFIVERDLLTALGTSDGQVAWQLPFAEKLAVAPVWDTGWLVVATNDGAVLAFRAIDGHLIWRRDLSVRAHAQPALAADRVYVPLDDGRVVALRIETGTQVWERRLGGAPADVLALDDRIYVGSNDNYLYCLATRDGKINWRWRTGADVIGLPVVDEDNVYFVSLDNVLRALSRTSGAQRWMRGLPLRPVRGPLKAGSTLVVTGVGPTIGAYNIKDGTPAGVLMPGGELAAPPYLVPSTSPVPEVLIVTRDVAKGASAVLVSRQIEPSIEPIGPLLNPVVLYVPEHIEPSIEPIGPLLNPVVLYVPEHIEPSIEPIGPLLSPVVLYVPEQLEPSIEPIAPLPNPVLPNVGR
jgi:outer membrane protein assembly factor BamB